MLTNIGCEPPEFLNIAFVIQQAIPMRNLRHRLGEMPFVGVDEGADTFYFLG